MYSVSIDRTLCWFSVTVGFVWVIFWQYTCAITLEKRHVEKRRFAEGFSPDAIAGRLAEKTRILEEMEDIVLKLQRFDCSYILENNIAIGEDQALL